MKRKIEKRLLEWKDNHSQTCLLVKGARQVGKTYSLDRFARENYKYYTYLNFDENPAYRAIFDGDLDVETLIKQISLRVSDAELEPGETILFLDEIQNCPRARTALKFLAIDGRFDVVASGSMLGIHYKEVPSYPVGYVDHLDMYSMDFEEFLWAKGYCGEQIEDLYQHMLQIKPLSELEQTVFSDIFREYMVIGGMPAIVNTFVKNNHYGGTLKMQQQILLDYEEDITKYASGLDKTKILNVYRKIPVFLGRSNNQYL